MVRARRRTAPGDRGAAALEFALVLPLLFVILFGIIEFGYGLFQMQAAQATVRQAARAVALGVDGCDEVGDLLVQAAEDNGFGIDEADLRSGMTLTITSPPGTAVQPPQPQRGDNAVLTISYEPTLDFPFVPFPGTIERQNGVTLEDVGPAMQRTCS